MQDVNDLVGAFNSQDYSRAKVLAEAVIQQGIQTEEVYGILVDCEMRVGDPNAGFGLALNLANAANSMNSLSKLCFWLASLIQGYRHDGNQSVVKAEFSETQLDDFFATIHSRLESSFSAENANQVANLVISLGVIGYGIDLVSHGKYAEFAKRTQQVFSTHQISLPSLLVNVHGKDKNLGFCAYYLASAGCIDEAEELMAGISNPYDPQEQLPDVEVDELFLTGENYDRPQIERTSRRLVSLMEDRSRLGRVLDIGSGTGMTANLIRNRCDQIVGIDLSEKQLEVARTKNLYDELIAADILSWKNDDRKFDTITAAGVVCLVPDLERLFSVLASLLSDNGRAYINVLTTSGDEDQRRLGEYILRTRAYVSDTLSKSELQIRDEICGPCQFAVGNFLTISKAP